MTFVIELIWGNDDGDGVIREEGGQRYQTPDEEAGRERAVQIGNLVAQFMRDNPLPAPAEKAAS